MTSESIKRICLAHENHENCVEYCEDGKTIFYESEYVDGVHFSADILWKDMFCDYDIAVDLEYDDKNILFDIKHIKHLRKLLTKIEERYESKKRKWDEEGLFQ